MWNFPFISSFITPESCWTEIPNNSTYSVDIAAGEEQSLQLAHEKAKSQFEALGYIVNIIDLPTV